MSTTGSNPAEVPFYPNTADNNQCMVSVYRSIFEHVLGKKMTQAEARDYIGYADGRAAWTIAPLTKMAQDGFDIVMIEPFDYRAFYKKGMAYLHGRYPADRVQWLLDHTNVQEIQQYVPDFLRTVRWEKRPATLQDIDNLLTRGYLVFVTLNSRVLQGEEGFVSHAVLIFGRDNDGYIAHDPGLPPQPNRHIARDELWQAMGGNSHAEEVTGFKKQTAVGKRLDQYVVEQKPRLSRAFAAKLIDTGKVTVNGGAVKPGYKVKAADDIHIDYDESILDTIPDIDLPVIYEDADCIVINKPTGVLTHVQGEFNPEATVASFLRKRSEGLAGDRAGVVHRLDRATSGVIIGAKNQTALRALQQQFADRLARKIYVAVVEGQLKEPEAVIDMPIERNPKAPATFRVGPNGKAAVTQYKVLQTSEKYSLVELRPQTGRTHQLRVHLQKIGHPIIGDPLYGSGKHGDRLYLHAQSLEITLPDGERKTFTAPLPPEFARLMQ